MTKRITFLVLALILISIQQIVSAQQSHEEFEYGSPADLRGVTHIYVDTGADIELRNKIVKEITKSLKNIVVTDAPYEGAVCLVYHTASQRYYAGSSTNGTVTDDGYDRITLQARSRARYRKMTLGTGSVVIMKPNNVVRIIMNFDDTKGDKPPLVTLFERKPSTNFARAFVKAYKEANKGFVGTPSPAAQTEPEPQAVAASVEPPMVPRQAVPIAAQETSSITINSTPDGADITIDGRLVGSTPSTVRLTPGDHDVTVVKPGFRPWRRVMDVTVDGTVVASLDKIHMPK